jgi:membrane associated rhomboid family serine protease
MDGRIAAPVIELPARRTGFAICQSFQSSFWELNRMNIRQIDRSFFASPHAAVYLLIAANILVYALCLDRTGSISADVLLRGGAMYSLALARHEYWRLLAYGFLHANLLHLTANMICLALWGGHLERRVGSFYFIVIYVCALIAGAVVSNATHTGPYLSVGASAGISGVLGALLSLRILARIDLPASFFVVNIGLNVALALGNSSIDWAAHLGGFAAGMIACALLDIVEKANASLLRCKFPEFIKINTFVVIVGIAFLFWGAGPAALSLSENFLPVLAYFVACCVAVKLVDLVLSLKKGLAIVALSFAAANTALLIFVGRSLAPALAAGCASDHFQPAGQAFQSAGKIETMRAAACANPSVTLDSAAAIVLVLTLLLYWPDILRGIKDVGFVSASLRAERNRRHGI